MYFRFYDDVMFSHNRPHTDKFHSRASKASCRQDRREETPVPNTTLIHRWKIASDVNKDASLEAKARTKD